MVGQMLGVLRRRWALTVILVVALEGGVFWGAFTFVGADLHQRFGLGFAAVGLAVAAFGAGGFLYVTVAPILVRLLGERGCAVGRPRLGVSFALLALAPQSRGVRRDRAVRRHFLHVPQHVADPRHADGARGARPALALFALCLFVGQAIGVPLAAPVVDRWGAVPVFWAAALVLPALALYFAVSLRNRRV